LAYLHEKEIIRRDIQPIAIVTIDNTTKKMKLIEFGICSDLLEDQHQPSDLFSRMTHKEESHLILWNVYLLNYYILMHATQIK